MLIVFDFITAFIQCNAQGDALCFFFLIAGWYGNISPQLNIELHATPCLHGKGEQQDGPTHRNIWKLTPVG